MTAPSYSVVAGRMVRDVELDETSLAAAVGLRPEYLPEGYVSIGGGPCVRLHRLPGMRISTQTATISADEAEAWAELFLRAAEEARTQVEEQRAEALRDESDCELRPRDIYGAGR